MKKYDQYKNSGVQWLGEIPEHWEVLSNKHIFKLNKNLVGKKSSEYDLLSLTLNGVIKRDMENPQGKFPAEFDTYQEVKKGDFIFCLFDVEETPRTVGLSDFDGMITGAYTVMQVNNSFDNSFLYYFYLNLDAGKRMKPLYTGLRNTISKDNFFAFKTFLPPLQEQTVIANFLDDKTTKIDQAIAIKQKQIELLKERRQILIHKAVTRGLNENVKLKDSCVEWIGEIPEHWEVKKMTNVCKIETGATPDRSNNSYWQGNIPWIKTGEVNYELITSSEEYITEKGLKNSATRLAPIGTLLMAMYGQGVTRGRVSILGIEATYNQACCAMLFNRSIFNKYGYYFFVMAYSYIRDGGNETSQMNISAGYISKIKIIKPPINEQIKIVEFIESASSKIASAISLKEREIEKMKEYKMSLIDGVVTGKVKVI